MPGKNSCLAELHAQKQELLVECELNRVQLLREWAGLKTSVRHAANPLRAARMVAKSTAAAAAAVAVFRRVFSRNGAPRHAWIHNLISGAKVGASLVSVLRARRQRPE